jgi:ribulose-bisphosphate carboxylase large chain
VGDRTRAAEIGTHIAVEQTVEFPVDLLPAGDIPDRIVGHVASVDVSGDDTHDVTVTYAVEIAGADLVQLLNVTFGNVSLMPGVRLVGMRLPPSMVDVFRGPRFGIDGIRRRVGAGERPLLSSALKPLGLRANDLANVAGALARGGVDLIKDDQGLADQSFGRFGERVSACADAIAEANSASGNRALYFANVTTRADRVIARAHEAKLRGATGLLVCPGLIGLDLMRVLADDDTLGLPIMSHPSFIGSHVAGPRSGIGHSLVFGTLQRLAGADISVFPSFGGRFSFDRAECREIANACLTPLGSLRPTMPAPGGGLTTASIGEAKQTYGLDAAYLVGGGLHRLGPDLEDNAKALKRLIGS